jgi:hypothetical protein
VTLEVMGFFEMAEIYPTSQSRYLENHNIHLYSCAKIIHSYKAIVFSMLLIKTKYLSNRYSGIGDEICMKGMMEGHDIHCMHQINAY